MSQHDWEELLSAYADGAVTPAERSTVESLLETTPEARRALAQIRTLSQTLHALPRETAPAGLKTAVLKRIQSPVTPAAATVPKRFRSYRREWLAGFSAIAMTVLAAGLLSLQFRSGAAPAGNPTAWFDDFTAPTSPVSLGIEPAERSLAEYRIERFGERLDGVEQELAASDQPTTADAKPGRGMLPFAASSGRADRPLEREATTSLSTAAGAVAAPKEMPAPARPELAELEAINGAMLAGSVDDVERLKEVLPYLRLQDENGQSIGNVDLVVVDAQRVANQFQVLLMENGVKTVDARTVDFDGDVVVDGTRLKATADPKTEATDLFAVYAEAPGEPLSKTLETLIKQREVLAMRLQPPLQMPAAWAEVEAPAEAGKPASGDRKLNLKQLTDAYVVQQMDDGLMALEGEPVSATDALAAARGEPTAQSRLHGNAQRRLPAKSEELTRQQKLTENVAPASPQAAGVALESNQNLASFNTLVKLPVAASADEAILSNRVQAEMAQNARNVRFNYAAPAVPQDFVQMRSRFARTAPDTVRVLFVLHPATALTPTPAGGPAPGR